MSQFQPAAGGAPVFGRRGAAAPAAATQNRAQKPDLAAAAQAIAKGKLPPWTRQGPAVLLAALIMFLAFGAGMTAVYGGDLRRDLSLAGSWRPALDLRAEDAHCTSYNYIVTLCDATLVDLSGEAERRIPTRFLMAFSSGSGEFLVPMRSGLDPTAIGVGYAVQDKLANRAITFGFALLIFGLAAFVVVRRLVRGEYKGGAAHRALIAGVVAIAGTADLAAAP